MRKKEFNCAQQFPGRKQKSKSFINSEEKKNYERERGLGEEFHLIFNSLCIYIWND